MLNYIYIYIYIYGLQSRIAKVLKQHIPNDFPELFARRWKALELDNAAIHDFTSIEQGTLSLELKHKFSKLPSQLPMFITFYKHKFFK